MARRAEHARPRGPVAAAWRRALDSRTLRVLRSDGFVLVSLSVLTAALCWANATAPSFFPVSMLSLVVLAGGFLLRLRSLLLLDLVLLAALGYVTTWGPDTTPGAVTVVLLTGAAVLVLSRTRTRLGVQGTLGESMLVDLRDRLRQQGEMPRLPPGWAAEVVLRPAGGASFSGDFLVASRSTDGAVFEVVMVDVSGKGVAAGTRALLLSGAFGGLLGSMPPEQFLPAANSYLLRQRWQEGFATAVHLVIDLSTGHFVVRTAGHPPMAHFRAGSGRWAVTEQAEGPALGLLADATYVAQAGALGKGDALLLYTDGLVENPGDDLSVGIDRLIGQAERLVTKGFRHGARKLIDAVATGEIDDRALVLIWRE